MSSNRIEPTGHRDEFQELIDMLCDNSHKLTPNERRMVGDAKRMLLDYGWIPSRSKIRRYERIANKRLG